MLQNKMLQKLRQGQTVLGFCTMYPAPGIIEGLAKGWDFVWICGQHGQIYHDSALEACRAAQLVGLDILLRVPGHEFGSLGQFGDMGPSALMVPMVDTPAQARSVVEGLCFAPLGRRSYGSRRLVDLCGRNYYRDYEQMIVAQIETLEALSNVEAIAATEGIGGLFFGPDDMKVQMGLPIDTPVVENQDLRDAMKKMAQAATKNGKIAAGVSRDPKGVAMMLDMGYRMIVGGGDGLFMQTEAARALKELQEVVGKANAPSGGKGSY